MLTKKQEQLIRAAEQLIAEQGLNNASDREIARHAQMKNNSAVQYHFGDRAGLIEALLEYRMVPLNQKRHELLDTLLQSDKEPGVRALMKVFVMPFALSLLENPDESQYVNVLSQLYALHHEQVVFMQNPERTSSLIAVAEKVGDALAGISQDLCFKRLSLAGLQVIHTVAVWDRQRRENPAEWDEARILEEADVLIDFVTGGLVIEPGG